MSFLESFLHCLITAFVFSTVVEIIDLLRYLRFKKRNKDIDYLEFLYGRKD